MMSAAVLFRNNENLVIPFFYFFRRNVGHKCGLAVVDNGSADNTVELLKKNLNENEHLFCFPNNRGIAGGRNKLVEMKKQFYGEDGGLFLIDSDLFILQQDSLLNMFLLANKQENVGIIYGKNFVEKGFSVGPYGFCFCYIKDEVLSKVGLFDERFKMFYDDTDFVKRTEEIAGYKVACCDNAVGIHICGQTTQYSEGKARRREIFEQDRKEFNAKWNVNDDYKFVDI